MATREVTIDNIKDTIEQNPIVILDFWAGWCRPCQMFSPIFEAASSQHPDVVFGKVDTEDQQQLAGQLGIQSIPTIMVFREGILLFREPGALRAPQLEQLLQGIKGVDMDDVRRQMEAQA